MCDLNAFNSPVERGSIAAQLEVVLGPDRRSDASIITARGIPQKGQNVKCSRRAPAVFTSTLRLPHSAMIS